LEDTTCDNDVPIPEYRIPVEARLLKYLRLWASDSQALTADHRPLEEELRSLFEWYICQCLRYGSLTEWWSDGVIRLEIRQTAPQEFKLLGVTWIGCEGVTPLEIDVELDPARSDRFAKTIFRIGALDEEGRPKVFGRRLDAGGLVEKRPRQNADWAMAVELTPPSG